MKIFPVFILITLLFSSCLVKHKQLPNTVDYESIEQIEIYNDSIVIKTLYDFPPDFLMRKAILEYKPILIIDNDSIELKEISFYEESLNSAQNSISLKYGGEFHIKDVVAIESDFNTLKINISSTGKRKSKSLVFSDKTIFKLVLE